MTMKMMMLRMMMAAIMNDEKGVRGIRRQM